MNALKMGIVRTVLKSKTSIEIILSSDSIEDMSGLIFLWRAIINAKDITKTIKIAKEMYKNIYNSVEFPN